MRRRATKRGTIDCRLQLRSPSRAEPPAGGEDEEVLAVRAVAKVPFQDRRCPVGVSSGHTKTVREKRAQTCRRESAGDQQEKPRRDNRPAKAKRTARDPRKQRLVLRALAGERLGVSAIGCSCCRAHSLSSVGDDRVRSVPRRPWPP